MIRSLDQTMLQPPPILRHRRLTRPATTAPAAALTLVAASYNLDEGPVIILTFDRAIELGAMVGGQIVVDDGFDLGLRFAATGAATMLGPASVQIGLNEIGDATGSGTTLTAGAGNGVVAADDAAAAWAGVTELELPFGA